MPMTILTFKDWVLTVDHESTKSTYAVVENGRRRIVIVMTA